MKSKKNNNKKNEPQPVQEKETENQEPLVEPVEDTKNEEAKETVADEEDLLQTIAERDEQIAELQDKFLRQVAEFDNYRKRTIKEKAELIKNGGERVIEAILPVIDDFERALQTAQKAEDIESVRQGIELIYHKFTNILKQQGLLPIETEGKEFNTDYHEAIALVPAPSEEQKGKILDTVQTGYLLNDKVIRHAKVAVGE